MSRTPLGAQARLLVVDDQEDVRTLLTTCLRLEGYQVLEARDAHDGLRCLADHAFNLVISDYAMPGGTGIWMLHEAERRGLLDRTPALLVTAHPDVRDASDFQIVRKPLDLDRFLKLVAHLLHQTSSAESRTGDVDVDEDVVELVLYVSSASLASRQARRNLNRTLDRFDRSRIRLTIRDLYHEPLAGVGDLIMVTPTLVKRRPDPKLWIVGNLHDAHVLTDVLEGAGLEPRDRH